MISDFNSYDLSRVLCKFFAHGACLKGEHCDFSHDWKDQANNVIHFAFVSVFFTSHF